MRQGSDKSRGAVYRWLKKHHRTIKAGFARTGAGWDSVVEAMISDGVLGRGGVSPTCGSVSKVWHRLCRDLEEHALQVRRPKRSRAGSWSPPTQPPAPAASRTPGVAGALRATSMTSGAPCTAPAEPTGELPDHVKENFAAIRRQFAYVDRHIVRSADEAQPSAEQALAKNPSVEEQIAEVKRQLAKNDRRRFGSM